MSLIFHDLSFEKTVATLWRTDFAKIFSNSGKKGKNNKSQSLGAVG